MRKVSAILKSAGPLSFSKPLLAEKEQGESNDAFRARTWRQHIHADADGRVFIPPDMMKNALAGAAKYLSESVPGKGKATWTKHFEAGAMIVAPIYIVDGEGRQIMRDDVASDTLFLPADGIRGSGKRVWKTYPVIPEWSGRVEVLLFDRLLIDHPEKTEQYLDAAGKYNGIGRFRPRNNGYYGRFTVEQFNAGK